jgi:polysaccharide export outer membrane protein
MSLRGTKRGDDWLKSQKTARYAFEPDAAQNNFSIVGGGDRSWEIILKKGDQSTCTAFRECRQLIRQSDVTARWTKYGSHAMKGFRFLLVVVLTAMPVAATAQAAPVSSAPVATTLPVAAKTPQTAAATATAPGPNYAGPLDASRYIIGPEDSLQVTVWKEPTLSGTIPVRPDGMISLVLVGDLPAAGQTPMALGTDIAQRLKKYIQDPVVTVVVLGVNSQRIFLVGEVTRVGPLMLTPGMTALQAIVSAGGLTQFANSKHIYILRTEAGKQQKMLFNYKQALKGNNQGLTLLPGDTIVVP